MQCESRILKLTRGTATHHLPNPVYTHLRISVYTVDLTYRIRDNEDLYLAWEGKQGKKILKKIQTWEGCVYNNINHGTTGHSTYIKDILTTHYLTL